MSKRHLALAALAGLALGLAVALTVRPQTVPQLINYQGRIADASGHPPADGSTVDITFTFYGASVGASPVYLQVAQPDVVVTNGLYDVLIGSGTVAPGLDSTLAAVFQNHAEVWMGVKVDANAEMSPRARITTVPYAFKMDTAWLTAFFNNPDYDMDGYDKVTGGAPGTVDCDDGDPFINPGMPDLTVDGTDQNCDGYDGPVPIGGTCTSAPQCQSNNCVDGYCCDTGCTNLCMACNLAGSFGACSNIPSGQDPDNECTGSTSCNGAGACTP